MPISTSLARVDSPDDHQKFSDGERESGIISTPHQQQTLPTQLWAQCKHEAIQRSEGRHRLQQESAGLLAEESQRRDKLALHLLTEGIGDNLLSSDHSMEDNAEDTHLISLEIAQSFFRQSAIDYLRQHHLAIRDLYLNQFSLPTTKDRLEIIASVSGLLIDAILPTIPSELSDLLKKEAIKDPNYHQKNGLAYFQVGQIYPTASGNIELNSPQDFDKVYGDLLAVLNGIGLYKWEILQAKQAKIQTQLNQYRCTNPALPHANFFNSTIKKPFRLFLLQEYMRQQLEAALTENPINNGFNLLNYAKQFGEKAHSTEVLDAFYQERLSSPSIYPENLEQINYRDSSSRISAEEVTSNHSSSHPPTSQPFSQSTFPSHPPSGGQAFLDKFRENMPKDLPLADLYKAISLIQTIAQTQPDLAEILVMKLETIVREYNPFYSAANLSPGSSQELLDLIAAAEYEIAQ